MESHLIGTVITLLLAACLVAIYEKLIRGKLKGLKAHA